MLWVVEKWELSRPITVIMTFGGSASPGVSLAVCLGAADGAYSPRTQVMVVDTAAATSGIVWRPRADFLLEVSQPR
jgi:hypothetical protein